MDNQFIEARQLIAKAREALRRGDKPSAQRLGEQAARTAPDMEDVWLVLTAANPDPQDALEYAQKALRINPQSGRAQRAVEWATNRLKEVEALKDLTPVSPLPRRTEAALPQPHAYQTAVAMPALKPQGRSWLLPILLLGIGLLFIGSLVLFAFARPALASLINNISLPARPQETLWAPADIVKPEVTPIGESAFAVQAENTPAPSAVPTESEAATEPPTAEPTEAPTDAPTEPSTVIPAATDTPGVVAMELVDDTPTSEYSPPDPEEIISGNGERWIDVDLTNQMVYAYEGDVIVNSFIVSTGTWLTPTVTGKHKIYVKVRVQDMRGPGYHLKDVPYVMFFSGDYGLHGTYWHNNFGTPMSRGCVNLTIDDAAWLFNWASVGTVVNVHY